MNRTSSIIAGALLLLASAPASAQQASTEQKAKTTAEKAEVDALLAAWPGPSKLAAYRTIGTYGLPNEASPSKLVWHDNGPWKRTVVMRKGLPHDFPKAHVDHLEQTIAYRVPVDKIDDLAALDGSISVDRTAGELSARGDTEQANFLALNLANDVVTGDKDVGEARKALGQAASDFTMGRAPEAMAGFQFEVVPRGTADLDAPVIAGAPRLARADERDELDDAQILAVLGAIDEHEVEASLDATRKLAAMTREPERDDDVRSYVAMLQRDHGRGVGENLALARMLAVTPVEGTTVRTLRAEGAESLARVLQLEDQAFVDAFIDLAIDDHARALNLIDKHLLANAADPELQTLLKTKRKMLAAHLKEAQHLRAAQRKQ